VFKNEEMEINMGPQHPSTHGVLRLKLKLDGEVVSSCRPVIGYLHRGVEKICENKTFFQGQVWTDRMDYTSAVANNLGWAEAVEKLFGITVPRRARYIRTMLNEFNRLASHLIWLATHGLDIGAMTVFLYTFREREAILDLFEAFCGARLTTTAFRIGGLREDLPPSRRWPGPSRTGSWTASTSTRRCSPRTGSGRSGPSASASSAPRTPSPWA